jgi:SAM-dependent methyltransferase
VSGVDLPEAALYWEARYAAEGKLWGDGPSELALLAVARLRGSATSGLSILDVGCGYGRDTRYLAAELGCRVLGLDPSPAAVAAARRQRSAGLQDEYEAGDLATFSAGLADDARFDAVFAANVYHLLQPIGRREFAAALGAAARPGGLLFLSTLSPRDARHYAVGKAVRGEERSWVDKVYLHFCTAPELTAEVRDFEVLDLDERSYEERNAGGVVHHHTSWFLEARRR